MGILGIMMDKLSGHDYQFANWKTSGFFCINHLHKQAIVHSHVKLPSGSSYWFRQQPQQFGALPPTMFGPFLGCHLKGWLVIEERLTSLLVLLVKQLVEFLKGHQWFHFKKAWVETVHLSTGHFWVVSLWYPKNPMAIIGTSQKKDPGHFGSHFETHPKICAITWWDDLVWTWDTPQIFCSTVFICLVGNWPQQIGNRRNIFFGRKGRGDTGSSWTHFFTHIWGCPWLWRIPQ